MVKVLFAAAESAPLYKTGGLGDVAYALPQALAKLGVTVRVVVPLYSRLLPEKYRDQLHDLAQFTMAMGGRLVYVGVKTLTIGRVLYYLIDNESFFDRDHLYGDWDDGGRFGFFQLALIEMLQVVNFIPDIIHVNDWHTAMVPVLLHDKYRWVAPYANIKTQLTIHNLQFQGWFPPSILDEVFGIGRQYFHDDGFAQDGQVNFMKGGINFADRVSTVSPRYAQEIMTPEFGEHLEGTLQKNAGKVVGILNGIDQTLYNPATDPAIAAHFSMRDLRGKLKAKAALQQAVGLPRRSDPLFGVVSRLTGQKGAPMLLSVLEDFLLHQNVQVVLLGTGDAGLEDGFKHLQQQFPGQMAAFLRFDEKLAQQIYAGSDFFLMPSAFEPSGLAQMMAMRYGAVPIVHEVGGLADSVKPYNEQNGSGSGFSFWDYRPEVLLETMQRAAKLYRSTPKAYQRLQKSGMQQNFDWAHAAKLYVQGYQELMR